MKLNFRVCIFLLIILAISSKRLKKKHIPKKYHPKRFHWRSRSIANAPNTTSIINYPFVVGLVTLYERYSSCFCVGAIITEEFVLTAAHCLAPFSIRNGITNGKVVVRAGTSNIRGSSGYDHRIYGYEIHEKFDPQSFSHDVALIKVKDKFVNDYQEAIGFANSVNQTERTGLAFGWGLSARLAERAERLHITEITDLAPCPYDLIENVFCGSLVDNKFCQRTFGQLVVAQQQLIGIVVQVPRECQDLLPVVITKLGEYKEWVAETSQNIMRLD